jgi:hypothetical protein
MCSSLNRFGHSQCQESHWVSNDLKQQTQLWGNQYKSGDAQVYTAIIQRTENGEHGGTKIDLNTTVHAAIWEKDERGGRVGGPGAETGLG